MNILSRVPKWSESSLVTKTSENKRMLCVPIYNSLNVNILTRDVKKLAKSGFRLRNGFRKNEKGISLEIWTIQETRENNLESLF